MNNKASGQELLKYINELPVSSNGLYDYPNQNVVVPTGGNITMQGIDYPVLGVSMETGESQLMMPEGSYDFQNTNNVLEIPQYQDGGSVNVFRNAVNFEKAYLDSNKIKERMLKMGLDPGTEISKLRNKLNGVTFRNGETVNGAHYNSLDNQIVATKGSRPVRLETMAHEVGHLFNRVNDPNADFVSDRNSFAEQSYIGRGVQNLRRKYNYDWYTKDGHETSPDELVADVHSLRQELLPTGYDGRYSNFTNEAYNNMRKIADGDPNSASARMLMKVGTPQLKYYYNILNKTMDELTPEDEAFLKRYEKDKKQHDAVQKKYIFEIMNKVVSNDKPNDEDIFYAQDGGVIRVGQIPPVTMTSLGDYNLGITRVPNAVQLENYDRPGSSTFQNFDEAVLNEYRDWENLDDFNIITADGNDFVPSKTFGSDEHGNYVDMSLDKFFPNGDNFYNRTYLPSNLQEQIDLQRAYQKGRAIPVNEMLEKTPYSEQNFENDKQFMRDYIGSDDYRNLLSNYYPDAKREQADRLARLGSVGLVLKPQDEIQALTKQDEMNVLGFVATAGDGYNARNLDPRYSAFNIDPKELDRKTFSRQEVDNMVKGNVVSEPQSFLDEFKMVIGDGIDNKAVNIADMQASQTGVHELGHFVRNAVSPNQFQDILKRTKNVGAPRQMVELPNGRFQVTDYVRTPTEITSRLDAMRYLLKQNGVKDTTKSLELTEKELQKALENPKIKADGNVQDLIQSTNSAQDLLWLLNNIVDNNSKPGQDLRQYMG